MAMGHNEIGVAATSLHVYEQLKVNPFLIRIGLFLLLTRSYL